MTSNKKKKLVEEEILSKKEENSKIDPQESFFEIVPVTTGIELEIQKELCNVGLYVGGMKPEELKESQRVVEDEVKDLTNKLSK